VRIKGITTGYTQEDFDALLGLLEGIQGKAGGE
jgi:hypothetical protein